MSAMLRVGFVGLGDQGAPMAEHIVNDGWPLAVFARRPEVIDHFAALGATVARSPRELGELSDVACVCVVDDAQVRDVVLGDEGILAGLAPGSALVIHSTVHPDTCLELAAVAAERGVHVLDAPVTGGGAAGARARQTVVMVGGDPEVFERCRPVFERYSQLVRWLGPLGSGQRLKLINNYVLGASFWAAYEACRLMRDLDIDQVAGGQILQLGSSGSWALNRLAIDGFGDEQANEAKHDKGALFATQVWEKDLRLFREVAEAAGVDIEEIDQAVARGFAVRRARAERLAGG